MYGLLLENMADFIKTTYGEDQWEHIRREAMVDMPSFSSHQVYPEALLPRLAKVACKVSPCPGQDSLLLLMGCGELYIHFFCLCCINPTPAGHFS